MIIPQFHHISLVSQENPRNASEMTSISTPNSTWRNCPSLPAPTRRPVTDLTATSGIGKRRHSRRGSGFYAPSLLFFGRRSRFLDRVSASCFMDLKWRLVMEKFVVRAQSCFGLCLLQSWLVYRVERYRLFDGFHLLILIQSCKRNLIYRISPFILFRFCKYVVPSNQLNSLICEPARQSVDEVVMIIVFGGCKKTLRYLWTSYGRVFS